MRARRWITLFALMAIGCGGNAAPVRVEGTEPGDCRDRADNDADGFFDCDDPGCTGSPDCRAPAVDAGGLDAAASEDGGADSGTGEDSGMTADSGTTDSGALDSGTLDAGTLDSGTPACATELASHTFEGTAIGAEPTGWLSGCLAGTSYTYGATATARTGTRALQIDFRGSGGEGAVGVPVTWPAAGIVEVSFAFQPQTTDQNVYVLAVQGNQRLFDSLPFERTGSLQGTAIPYQAGRWYDVRYRIDMTASQYRMFVDGAEIRSGMFERSAVPCSLAGGSYLSFHGGFVDQKWVGSVDDLRIEHLMPECAPAEHFALRFDGSGDEVQLPMSLGDVGDRFTFEAWVRPTGTGGSSESEGALIFTHRADCTDFDLEWSGSGAGRNPDRFRFRVYPESSCSWAAAESGTTSALGEWHHVAGVFDAGALRLYVDGALAGTATLSEPISWSHALRGHWIGRDGADGRPNRAAFVGDIDEVRVSRGARYTGSTFTPPAHLEPDATTVAAWLLDEGTGTSTQDASSAGHNGTIRGATWVRVAR